MARDDILTGIDIGSTTIRVVMAQRAPTGGGVQIVGAAEGAAEGISKGVVVGIEDAVSAISNTIERVERMTGIPVEHAFIGINGTHVTSQASHGVIAVAKADGEIREDDVERVVEAAQAVATPPNYEILHIIPRSFTVDNQKGMKDPIGMTGIRLEVDAQIIQGFSSQIKNLTKTIYRTSVDIDDLVLGCLAAAEACLSSRQKDIGVALAVVGATTTQLVVFEEGDVLHTKVLPIGSGHITNDIAIGLRTSIDLAERIKVEFGSALPEEISKRDDVNLADLGGEEALVSRKHIAEIIEARLEEICTMVDAELRTIDRSGLLPAGIVLTGGGAKLPGILDVAKREFRLPASLGLPTGFTSAIDKVQDPTFTTAIGLVLWGAQAEGREGFSLSNFSSIASATDRMRKWLKSLLP